MCRLCQHVHDMQQSGLPERPLVFHIMRLLVASRAIFHGSCNISEHLFDCFVGAGHSHLYRRKQQQLLQMLQHARASGSATPAH